MNIDYGRHILGVITWDLQAPSVVTDLATEAALLC
jgi:hypothetical protein